MTLPNMVHFIILRTSNAFCHHSLSWMSIRFIPEPVTMAMTNYTQRMWTVGMLEEDVKYSPSLSSIGA